MPVVSERLGRVPEFVL
ncbi:unnamed protein product [Oppiella nova]|uniref:Uncharacterized protein n=1 Tax=Oppiella nova TaxID=334625 RepID=A0A7R9MU58_9ACAR|nr:unnamed protein product [Oppiella nova]CAG2183426.1 unnamed protein product [Oppiella nova]